MLRGEMNVPASPCVDCDQQPGRLHAPAVADHVEVHRTMVLAREIEADGARLPGATSTNEATPSTLALIVILSAQ